MVNPTKLESLVRRLEEYTGHLHDLHALGKAEILADPYKRGAARYYLQITFECCLHLSNHLIASAGLRPPVSHRDTFQILNEADIVPDEFVQTLQQMASMRNRLVHFYAEIDDEIVFEALQTAPKDCERLVKLIFEFIDSSNNQTGETP